MLRVAPITVRRYIADGRLPAVTVGKGVRVTRSAVERLLRPIEPSQPDPSSKRGSVKVFDEPDSLFHLVGIADTSDGIIDVSANKDKYLADAYTHGAR